MRRATGIRFVIAIAVPQLFLAACGGGGSGGGGAPSGSSGAQIVAASAPSKHYVEVSFSEPVDGAAVRADRYSIAAAGGGALAVHEAHLGDDASVVVLT